MYIPSNPIQPQDLHYVTVPTAVDEQAKMDPKQWVNVDIPMYDPHQVLAYLWDEVGITVSEEAVHSFWNEARANGIPWAFLEEQNTQRLPIKLFGDDCTYNQQLDKCLAIVISCPLWRPKSARNTRWIIAVLKLNSSVGFETVRPVLARCVWSLNLAYETATAVAKARFVVTEIAGDWKYLREAFNWNCHWNHTTRICHHCRITREEYAMLPDNLSFRTTAEFISEVLPVNRVTPLILLRSFDVTKITWCQLHNLNLGLLWTCNGGCIALLLERGWFGDPSDGKRCLRTAYDGFKKWQKENHFSCSQRRFTFRTIFKAAHGAYLSGKGYNSRVVCAWLADEINNYISQHPEPLPDEVLLTAHAMQLDSNLKLEVCMTID